MKILINHKFISDAPFKGDNEDFFVFDNIEDIEQIKREILHGTSTCYLVSGYRGVGKTSFISKVEHEINKEDISRGIFIKINTPKYESYSFLLRKIIRGIYLSTSNHYNIADLRKQNRNIIKRIELLFDRTFSDVEHLQKNSLKHEKVSSLNFSVNLKKLTILVIAFVVTGLNLKFNLIDVITSFRRNKYIDLFLFSIPAFWATFELFKYKKTLSKTDTEFAEISRKTLYDDEIAETQLINLLEDLNTIGLYPVFVLDELDKIDNVEQLESLIGDLKPVMLSGLASFILVSGQELYYKFNSAHVHDDALIASIFSNTVHIPLLSKKGFFDMFKKILDDPNLINEKPIQDYVNSQILNSNRLPRRFIHLIRQDLRWENEKAYLKLDDNDMKAYETDAKLLKIIDLLKEKELLEAGYGEGIIDFFTTQLHIWIQKIKLRGNSFFNKEEVYNIENDYKSSHPSWYFTRLNTLIASLLEKLSELDFLEKMIEKSEQDEEIIYYRWTEQVTIKTDINIDAESEFQSQFLSNFIKFESSLRKIYEDVFRNNNLKRRHSPSQMIKALEDVEIKPLRWIKDDDKNGLKPIMDLRNRIVHGESINLNDLDNAHIYNVQLTKIRSQLNTEYTYYIIKKNLNVFDYFITDTPFTPIFDCEAVHKTDDKAEKIIFTVNDIQNFDVDSFRRFMASVLNYIRDYNEKSSQGIYYVFIFHGINIKSSRDRTLKQMFDGTISDHFFSLKDKIVTLYIPKEENTDLQETVAKTLDNLLKKGFNSERIKDIVQ
ncbi:ATP-binding protein [Priestia megaterium]|uniref:ATP-binding protein n=1 Tax=Priestia megaterium TaxID=1404 RepID=UPI001493E3BB|nr:ATP-binding protein [Priestia megaterium]